ncbi:MAG: hypothetical protein BGO98_03560 [Myxococcales bacterium 68-20]|nr:MAG: hypothetical protein BGO98_03560 [Myxococcales bacterium 68-20]
MFLFACASVALGTGIACATSEDEAIAPQGAESEPVVADAAADAPAADAAVIEPPDPATCSSAGWCLTPLPDADLTLIDIWPFKGRAFAVAVSASIGAKVMEWVDADQRWTYIDDNSQNQNGFGRYVGRMWAPNEDEVYYTVEPGYVYHGRRGATWSWERELLVPASVVAAGRDTSTPVVNSPESAALGVWGTSADDVYAWRADTIYHRTSVDGGAPEWVEDYVGPGAPNRVFISGAGGSGKDDVWFSGGNGGTDNKIQTCPLLLRKTPDGYRAVVDGTLTRAGTRYSCPARPDTVELTGPGASASTSYGASGAMVDVHVGSGGQVVVLRYASTLTRLIPEDGGYVSTSEKLFSPAYSLSSNFTFTSLWVHGDEAWLSGAGLLLQGPVGADAGAFGVSSVALTGAPLDQPLYRIRGTDDSNLWAIGARYAFHKTTP